MTHEDKGPASNILFPALRLAKGTTPVLSVIRPLNELVLIESTTNLDEANADAFGAVQCVGALFLVIAPGRGELIIKFYYLIEWLWQLAMAGLGLAGPNPGSK